MTFTVQNRNVKHHKHNYKRNYYVTEMQLKHLCITKTEPYIAQKFKYNKLPYLLNRIYKTHSYKLLNLSIYTLKEISM